MIMRQFLSWIQNASASGRAEATSALVKAYLWSDLCPEDHRAAEGAMLMLMDDPSPLVRLSLAQALAPCENAPHAIIQGLMYDQEEIASLIMELSPLLLDAELVDAVARGSEVVQASIARRARVSRAVAAAIIEIGDLQPCLRLLENPDADIAPASFERLCERFGDDAHLREVMLRDDRLPASTRQILAQKLASTLASFVQNRGWLGTQTLHHLIKDATENATVAIAADQRTNIKDLVRHLRETGQLTAGLILRALLTGQRALFDMALSDLSGIPLARTVGLIEDRRGAGIKALYQKAGLPQTAWPAFRAAVEALHEFGFASTAQDHLQLRRRMVERVLTRYSEEGIGDVDQLFVLLRRLQADTAREEARAYCSDLVDLPARLPMFASTDYEKAA